MAESASFNELDSLLGETLDSDITNFFELAAMLGLDPKRDFAGADLSGTDIAEGDLAGADLTGTDLRGANLSSTNLQKAKLSGALLDNARVHQAVMTNCVGLSKTQKDDLKKRGAIFEAASVRNTDPNVSIESEKLERNLPTLHVGDTVRLGIVIQAGGKRRIQPYEGTVIAIHNSGLNQTITVRRLFQGIGVERVFRLRSPRIASIKVLRRGRTRRAKLLSSRRRKGKGRA